MLGPIFAIRVAIVNHRTNRHDIDTLVEQTLRLGAELLGSSANQLTAAV